MEDLTGPVNQVRRVYEFLNNVLVSFFYGYYPPKPDTYFLVITSFSALKHQKHFIINMKFSISASTLSFLLLLLAAATTLAQDDDDDCPNKPSCCEEDCCEENTIWITPRCWGAPNSPGWTGVNSDEYVEGCVQRACCELDCCGQGTVFDPTRGTCVRQFP